MVHYIIMKQLKVHQYPLHNICTTHKALHLSGAVERVLKLFITGFSFGEIFIKTQRLKRPRRNKMLLRRKRYLILGFDVCLANRKKYHILMTTIQIKIGQFSRDFYKVTCRSIIRISVTPFRRME